MRPQAIAQRTFLGTFSISPHPSSTYPIAPGDIEAFKGMPLISLNLLRCNKLTGVFGLGWGMVGGVKIGNRVRPQAIAQRTFLAGQRPKNLPRNLLHLVKMFRNIIAHTANTSSPFAGKDKAKKMFPNADVTV